MAITRYVPEGQETLFGLRPSSTDTSLTASYTGTAAYDPRTLTPPVPPTDPPVNTQFAIQLVNGDTPGLSIKHHGAFLGFSVEFSVSNHVLGRNGSTLSVPFLNLLANLQQRSGRITVRVGGNSQETAMMVPSLPNGRTLEKDKAGLYNPTQTPPLVYTPEILYMMSNISSLVNVDWFLGVPFNDTTNWRLDIVSRGQQILGDRLLGFQVGNEPDLYVSHGRRSEGYGPVSYKGEIASLVNAMRAQGLKTQNQFVAPSVNGKWPIEEVIEAGLLTDLGNEIGILSVEKYPSDNCAAAFNTGAEVRQPQEMLPMYLTHATGVRITQQYLNVSRFAQEVGKPFMMFETNSASCGGFPGISDAFAAALWGLDYGLMMAYSNFTGALYHVGGQNVYYSPFTPPPSNQTAYRQWTVGPMYYSVLAMAEILGRTNQSQVVDLGVNNGDQFTPGYAIYENGTPMRLALFNYLDDSSGAYDLKVTISIGGGETEQPVSTPSSVRVKYLLAEHVTSKVNITWAGQTLGANFKSDGRLRGEETIVNIPCDTANNTCTVTVPAPGFALVFLNDKAFQDSTPSGNTITFATTARTKTVNTATIDPKALETSNGHRGKDRVKMQSTSKGSSPNGASRLKEGLAQVVVTGLGVVFGVALVTLL